MKPIIKEAHKMATSIADHFDEFMESVAKHLGNYKTRAEMIAFMEMATGFMLERYGAMKKYDYSNLELLITAITKLEYKIIVKGHENKNE